jgi:hypothetical protein
LEKPGSLLISAAVSYSLGVFLYKRQMEKKQPQVFNYPKNMRTMI